MMKRIPHYLLFLVLFSAVARAEAPPAPPPRPAGGICGSIPNFAGLVEGLGANDYRDREKANRELLRALAALAKGANCINVGQLAACLRSALGAATDAEIRRRLLDLLSVLYTDSFYQELAGCRYCKNAIPPDDTLFGELVRFCRDRGGWLREKCTIDELPIMAAGFRGPGNENANCSITCCTARPAPLPQPVPVAR